MTRTTISLDDHLANEVRRLASTEGKSVSAFIAGVLKAFVTRREPAQDPPFELITAGGSGPRPGIDLDRIRTLEVAEDEETWSNRR